MNPALPKSSWLPIRLLSDRFSTNITALTGRYPELAKTLTAHKPSQNYCIRTDQNRLLLGSGEGDAAQPMPVILTPASAKATIAKLFPKGNCDSAALVCGEDLGWLWNALYVLPCQIDTAPGHRPPLYFLIRDIERLWVILHLQNWTILLTDPRVRLFAGADCVELFHQSLTQNPMLPWPRQGVDVTPDIWPMGMSLATVIANAAHQRDIELARLSAQLNLISARNTPSRLADVFNSGRPLKVMGITSRFSTFLQHSMRDWLDAFQRLGHQTRLMIESADHEAPTNLTEALGCVEFQPDLIVAIDHQRSELAGMPNGVPMVMWIQDFLPALFNSKTGRSQGPLDFAMGFDPMMMVHEFGYPADRFMGAVIGVNEKRFNLGAARKVQNFECDVSYVSHASTTADVLLKRTLDQLDSKFAIGLITEIFDRLRQVYKDGGSVTEPISIRRMIDRALLDRSATIQPEQIQSLMDLFTAQINNALFRHQSLQWIADAGVDLHLYGRGWEQHPTLAKFARGPADNQNALAAVYRSSKINLHTSPHGAVHQRVMEGLACGGFFMLRSCPGDTMEREFIPVWEFCQSRGITTDAQLQQQATPQIQDHLDRIAQALQKSPFDEPWPLVDLLRSSDRSGYIRSAGTIWGDDYDAVSFGSASEAAVKINHFLNNPQQRETIAQSMRRPVMERFTYVAMTRQLLDLIAGTMQRNATRKAAA